jgi:hypothetical protein
VGQIRLVAAAAALAAALSGPAAAEQCALDDPNYAPPPVADGPADVVLMSIALDAQGDLVASSAKGAGQGGGYAEQIDRLVAQLAPHQPPAGARTPFDMAVERSTIVVFRLEPGAWSWESEPARALFLKPTRPDGQPQRHNPFVALGNPPGRPRFFAARFDAPAALAGCVFYYNLGVIVRGAGGATPVILDPMIKNGGGGAG